MLTNLQQSSNCGAGCSQDEEGDKKAEADAELSAGVSTSSSSSRLPSDGGLTGYNCVQRSLAKAEALFVPK